MYTCMFIYIVLRCIVFDNHKSKFYPYREKIKNIFISKYFMCTTMNVHKDDCSISVWIFVEQRPNGNVSHVTHNSDGIYNVYSYYMNGILFCALSVMSLLILLLLFTLCFALEQMKSYVTQGRPSCRQHSGSPTVA